MGRHSQRNELTLCTYFTKSTPSPGVHLQARVSSLFSSTQGAVESPKDRCSVSDSMSRVGLAFTIASSLYGLPVFWLTIIRPAVFQ